MAISITDLLKQYGSAVNTVLPTPSYQPVNVDVNSLRAQQANLQKLADDPLADVGVQNTLAGIRTALTAGQNSAIEAAKGRATRTGQAGFYGALAGAGQRAMADRAMGLSQAQAQLAAATSTNARNQMSDLAKSILNAQLQGEQIATQRGSIEQQGSIADLQARLQQQNTLLDAAIAGRGQDTSAENATKQLQLQEEQLKYQQQADRDRLALERQNSQLENQLKMLQLEQAKKQTTLQQQNAPLLNQVSQAQAQLELLKAKKQIEILGNAGGSLATSGGTVGRSSVLPTIDYRNPMNRSVITPMTLAGNTRR